MFRYPGGKHKLKDRVIKEISKLSKDIDVEYREPFYGGGSIGNNFIVDKADIPDMWGQKIKKIWVNDRDPGISCIWTAVIRYAEALKQAVSAFTPSVENFHKFKEELIGHPDPIDFNDKEKVVHFALMKLGIHQTSYSGLGVKSGGPLGGGAQDSEYKIDCRWSVEYIHKNIDTYHRKYKFIDVRERACTCRDFEDLISAEGKCIIYADPPYYIKGDMLYQFSFTTEDHERLSQLLRNTKHRWVLSYDDCDAVKRLYSWATIEVLDANYTIAGSRDKTELLIYRRD